MAGREAADTRGGNRRRGSGGQGEEQLVIVPGGRGGQPCRPIGAAERPCRFGQRDRIERDGHRQSARLCHPVRVDQQTVGHVHHRMDERAQRTALGQAGPGAAIGIAQDDRAMSSLRDRQAQTGVAGPVVAEVAYRNDAIAVQGQRKFAEEAWRENKCRPSPPAAAAAATPAETAASIANATRVKPAKGAPPPRSGSAVH